MEERCNLDVKGSKELFDVVLWISCSFSENLANLYVGVPPGGLAPPATGNPRSARVDDQWRIQDFRVAWGGALAEGKSLLFGKIFAENCMKMKETAPRGGAPSWIRQRRRWIVEIKFFQYFCSIYSMIPYILLSSSLYKKTRIHSSRIRTVRSSGRLSRGRGSASVHAGTPTPPGARHPPSGLDPPGTRHIPLLTDRRL